MLGPDWIADSLNGKSIASLFASRVPKITDLEHNAAVKLAGLEIVVATHWQALYQTGLLGTLILE